VDLIVARDPLEARIGAAERRRRLASSVADTEAMLSACVDQLGDRASQTELALQDELRRLESDLKSPAAPEPDAIEDAMDLEARIARTVMDRCPPATPLEQALVALANAHGAAAH
jgi:hypothetical protein